jgi:hypothetical protein
MIPIHVPTAGAASWRALLADPKKQWRRARSAWELAVSWEAAAAAGLPMPAEVADAFARQPRFGGVPEVLIAIPEHCVPLDTTRRPSQNDLWLLLRAGDARISVAVEGKAGETFGLRIQKWYQAHSAGKERRLRFVCRQLGLGYDHIDLSLRYQLLHRAASAVIEARRWGASEAVLLVQSFGGDPEHFADFARFAEALEIEAERGAIAGGVPIVEVDADGVATGREPVMFSVGWVDSEVATDGAAIGVFGIQAGGR